MIKMNYNMPSPRIRCLKQVQMCNLKTGVTHLTKGPILDQDENHVTKK